jgi:fused signal recognition particle receptor
MVTKDAGFNNDTHCHTYSASIKTPFYLQSMFDKLKSAIGGFVKSVTGKVEKKEKKVKKTAENVEKKPVLKKQEKTQKKILKKPEGAKGIAGILKRGIDAGLKAVTEQTIDEAMLNEPLDQLVISLIEASVALDVAEDIGNELRKTMIGKKIVRGNAQKVIHDEIKNVLFNRLNRSLDVNNYLGQKPSIIVLAGINGSGKTTTVAKVVRWLQKKKQKVVLAAADTYRAAAIEQLQKHADKLNVKMIKHEYGADAAAVCFDAVQHAKAHNLDAVIIDTAGRMHAAQPLMDELKKIIRVTKPHLVLLIIDSLVGNDAIEQLNKFKEVRVDAVILTKSDLDKKGGVALSIASSGTPIAFLATGQEYDKFETYDPKKFMKMIMGS